MNSHREVPAQRRADRPSHPTKQAVLLLIGVTLLLIVLAVSSTAGHL